MNMNSQEVKRKLNIDNLSLSHPMGRVFHVIVEQDQDGMYIGRVPELRGCVSQGETLEELMKNIKEAIELCLEVKTEEEPIKFVGVQEVEVV